MQATSVFDDKTKQKIYAKQKGICPSLQEALQVWRDGSRPHSSMERRRQNGTRKLPNALQSG